jgi:hypothetical protein
MLTKFSVCGVWSVPRRRTHICNQRLLSPQDFLGTVMASQSAICLILQDIYLTRGSNALRLARLGLETRWNGSWNGFVPPLPIMKTDHIDDFLGRYHRGRNEDYQTLSLSEASQIVVENHASFQQNPWLLRRRGTHFQENKQFVQ